MGCYPVGNHLRCFPYFGIAISVVAISMHLLFKQWFKSCWICIYGQYYQDRLTHTGLRTSLNSAKEYSYVAIYCGINLTSNYVIKPVKDRKLPTWDFIACGFLESFAVLMMEGKLPFFVLCMEFAFTLGSTGRHQSQLRLEKRTGRKTIVLPPYYQLGNKMMELSPELRSWATYFLVSTIW